MSHIYINTGQSEEHRIVIAENGKLTGFEQDIVGWENKKGDIYKAIVTRIEEGLDAAFVNFGEGKNGFLPLKHVTSNLPGASGGKNKLAEGDSILVQIKKDHVGDKGAGLTTNISLAGCYLVLMPNRREKTFISKNVPARERQKTAETLAQLSIPEGMSVILRTAGGGCSIEDLRWDLESYLLKLWQLIESAAATNRGPILIYRENNLMLRAVRDYFKPETDNIYCDDIGSYEELKNFVSLISPEGVERVHYHEGDDMVPDAIEQQIDLVYEREVKTPAGARLVFDSTEAMVTIDVNSAQTRGHSDIEATALRANMDAAEAIARHLRLRDLGGLIAVDFIDMSIDKNRQKLEEYFAGLLRRDRARVQWAPLSKFGIMELSRQRLSRPVEESQSIVCVTCQGTGRQRRADFFALRLLRQIRLVARQQGAGTMIVQSPAATAVYLLNEKRAELRRLEEENKCEILVAPVTGMYPPDFKIRRIKDTAGAASYQQDKDSETSYAEDMRRRLDKKNTGTPAAVIKTVLPEERTGNGLLDKLWRALGGLFTPPPPPPQQQRSKQQNKPRREAVADKAQNATSPGGEEAPKKKRPPRRQARRRSGPPAETKTAAVIAEAAVRAKAESVAADDVLHAAETVAAPVTKMHKVESATRRVPATESTASETTEAVTKDKVESAAKVPTTESTTSEATAVVTESTAAKLTEAVIEDKVESVRENAVPEVAVPQSAAKPVLDTTEPVVEAVSQSVTETPPLEAPVETPPAQWPTMDGSQKLKMIETVRNPDSRQN